MIIFKLSTDSLPNYFEIASAKNSHYSESTNCFDFVDRQSNCLLVTVGDSWTWGQKLTNRLQEVYGNRISDHYKWDWLNLSVPGSSNFFIAEKVQELKMILHRLHYEKIIIICTFTEIGRGFNSHHDLHINYRSWLDENLHTKDDFYLFLSMLNKDCVDRIYSSIDSRCRVIYGTNFVNNLALPMHDTLPMTWNDIISTPYPIRVYASSTGVSRLKDIEEFVPRNRKHLYKIWFAEMIDQAKYVDLKWFSRKTHPDSHEHDRWAKFIIDYLS